MRRFDGKKLLVATHNAGKLAEMRERQTRAIVSLARSMRLTQQARIHPVTAGRTGNLDPERRKPWEPLV